ncbi:MAG: type IV secretion system protein [Rickettsiales bacterium]
MIELKKFYIIKKFASFCHKITSSKNLLILFLFLSINSCSDSGCIEADDFGEYDVKNISVYSNNTSGLCKFNTALKYDNPNQPILFKGCIMLENCSSKSSDGEKLSCAKECEAKCKNNPVKQRNYATRSNYSIPSSRSLSEPNWKEVGDSEFKIYENTKIMITATGEIEIGEKGGEILQLQKDDLVDELPTEDKTKFMKISANDQIKFKISADFGINTERASVSNFVSYFQNPTFNSYPSSETVSSISQLKNNELKSRHPGIVNGSKRIFAYFIPTPTIPEIGNDSLIPIMVKPYLAACSLEPNTNWYNTRTTRYIKAGCSNVDDDDPDKYVSRSQEPDNFTYYNRLISKAFQIDNNINGKNVKYNDSGFLLGFDEFPLSSNRPIENTDYKKNISSNLLANTISTSLTPPNQFMDYEVRLVLSPENPALNLCRDYFLNANTKPRFAILNEFDLSPDNSVNFTSMVNETDSVIINNFAVPSNIRYTYKSLKMTSGQKILIEKKDIPGDDQADINSSCIFELHFYPYYSIPNNISGYVKFGHVNYYNIRINGDLIPIDGTVSTSVFSNLSNCNMSINIKNPDGTYEFSNNNTYVLNNDNNSNRGIYLRKGQQLLIKPDIWDKNYTFNSSGVSYDINCGVGFYIEKKPKPAVLCHKQVTKKVNVNEDYTSSNDCKNLLIVDNVVQGCSTDYSLCNDYKNTDTTINNNFCPTECLPTEEQIKTTSCKPSITNGVFSAPINCPNISSITNFDYQTTAGTSPLSFKTIYDKINIKCNVTCPANSASICQNFSNFYSATTSKYFATYDALSASDKTNFMTFDKCKSCLNANISKLQTNFLSTDSTPMDLCYDLENYTGSLYDFYTLSPAVVDRMEVPELKNKGIDYLKPFVNSYGNFYPLSYNEENSPWTTKNYYDTKNSTFLTSNGYLKVTLITNAIDLTTINPSASNIGSYNIDFINNVFYNFNDNKPLIKDLSKVQLVPSSSSKFLNGQRLSVVPCHDDGSGICSGYDNSDNLIRSNPIAATDINLVPKIISFTSDTGLINPSNNYSFNELGNLTRITNQIGTLDLSYDCTGGNQPFIGANFLCLNNQGSIDDNRLSFKIIDNEKTNCIRSTGASCLSTSPGCNGSKSINLMWDGKDKGTCSDQEENCTKNYYCADPYFNNSGKYDVKIRVMNPEKTRIANLVNSIISPVMEELDGYSKDKDETLDLSAEGSFYNIVYRIYPSSVRSVNINTVFTESNIFNLSGENIVGTWKGSFNQNLSTDPATSITTYTINANIPPKTDGECANSNGCVIAYVGAFIGDLRSDNKVDIGTVDASGNVTSRNCFSSTANLRNNIVLNCIKKKSCSFTLKATSNPSATMSNDFGYNYVSSYTSDLSNESPGQICNKPLRIFVAYKIASKPMEKENQAKRIYTNITNNPIFKSVLSLSMVLMITFYGLGFMMGVSEMKQSEIMNRLLKMGLIYLFTSPSAGWIFFEKFFVTFFKDGADFLTFLMASIFSDGEQINSALNSGNFRDKSPLFESVDRVLGLYLINDVVHKKITALLFYNFVGILYCVILYYCAITYVYAASNAVLLYLTAQFFTTVLFVIGPFFFIFILFKQTKGFFDNWLNSLIGFALQQIFVIFTLNIFNSIIYMVTKMALSYRICWDSVWNINSFGFSMSVFSYWTIQDAPPYINDVNKVNVNGEYKNTTPSLTMIILTWSMVTIMRSFLSTISDLAAQLSGGIQASSLGAGVSAGVNQAIGKAKQLGSKAFDKMGGNKVLRTVDKEVFGSGADAKMARKKKRQQNKNDRIDIANMAKAGNDAVSKYKQENAAEFAKMSEGDKKKKLMEVKKNAMIEYAKGSGKSQKDVDRLMNLKGFRGNGGSNIFGAGINLVRSGGSLRTSLADSVSSVDTGFSDKEIKGAMSNMDEGQRKDFMKSLKSGEIQKSEDNAIRNPGDLLKKPFSNPSAKAREEAIKQLEDSGKITKKSNELNSSTIQSGLRMIGAESKRSNDDEKLIQAQMEKNAVKASVDKGSNFSAREINKFEKLAKYQDAKDIGDKDGMKEARGEYKTAKKAAKTEGKTSASKRSDEQVKESSIRLDKSAEENKNKIADNQKAQEAKGKEISKVNDDIKSNPKHKEMDDLNSKIKDGSANDDEKSKFNKMVIDDNKESQKSGEQSYLEKDSMRSNLKEDLAELKDEGDSLKKGGEKLQK